MLNCVKVAVTGGLSSGKSSVCRLFMKLGAYVVSADEIVHHMLSPDTQIGQKVIKLIGPDIVVDQQLDRRKIAHKVFNDLKLLKSLEQLLHPEVQKQIENKYKEIRQKHSIPLFVAEIPLLFESNGAPDFDFIITVLADKAICQNRFTTHTNYTQEEFNKRSERQFDMQKKARHADFVIYNNGTFNDLKEAVQQIYEKLIPQT